MKICIITGTFFPENTGVSIHLYNILNQFSKMGHKVLLLCPDYSIEPEIYPNAKEYIGEIFKNVFVKAVPSKKNERRATAVKYADYSKWDIEDYLHLFKPDIIQVDDADRIYGNALYGMEHTMAYNKCIGVDYGKKHSIPVITYYHTNFPAFCDQIMPPHVVTPYRQDKKGIYQKVFNQYDLVLCSCEDSRINLENHDIKNIRSGAFVGISEEVFSTKEKSELVNQNDNVKLLYAGRFDGGKDVRRVIDIYNEAKKNNANIELYLAGDGSPRIMEYVRDVCNQNSDIKYIGLLEQRELAKVYNSVDIYLSPQETDTLGLSIIEAMSSSLPVIAADKGGPVSLIQNGYNGFLCSENNEFVEKVGYLVNEKDIRQQLGKNSYQFAQKYFTSNCAKNLVSVYKELSASNL